jgi:hypothetical protein
MFQFLNKLLGATAGIILYPLKSLLITLGFIALHIIFLPILLIGFPILVAVLAAITAESARFTAALFAWLISGTISIIVFPVLILLSTFSVAYNGIKDLFRAVSYGARDGYEGGLFFHVLNRFVFDFLVFSSYLQIVVSSVIARFGGIGNNALNDEGFNALYQEDDDVANYFDLENVPHSSLSEIPDLHQQPKVKKMEFKPLSSDELQRAEGISDILGKAFTAYKSLHERLTELDADIAKKGDSNADLDTWDEVSYVPITQPALLVKQYQDQHQKWRVVPNHTQIIDKPGLDQWLRGSNSHPKTREPMDKATPETIDGISRETRYRVRSYNSMNDAQELLEASIVIRKKLEEANPANIQVGQVVTGITTNFRETFFGNVQNSANNQEERAGLANNII